MIHPHFAESTGTALRRIFKFPERPFRKPFCAPRSPRISSRLLLALATLLPWLAAFAQTPRDYAVDLKVIPSPTVPRITLTWTQRQQAAITGQQVYRRLKGEVTWNLLATAFDDRHELRRRHRSG